MPKQPFGNIKIAYNAVTKRAYGNDLSGSPSEHTASLFTDSDDPAGTLFNGNDCRFAQDDALILHIDKHTRCTEIDTDIVVFKQTHYKIFLSL